MFHKQQIATTSQYTSYCDSLIEVSPSVSIDLTEKNIPRVHDDLQDEVEKAADVNTVLSAVFRRTDQVTRKLNYVL